MVNIARVSRVLFTACAACLLSVIVPEEAAPYSGTYEELVSKPLWGVEIGGDYTAMRFPGFNERWKSTVSTEFDLDSTDTPFTIGVFYRPNAYFAVTPFIRWDPLAPGGSMTYYSVGGWSWHEHGDWLVGTYNEGGDTLGEDLIEFPSFGYGVRLKGGFVSGDAEFFGAIGVGMLSLYSSKQTYRNGAMTKFNGSALDTTISAGAGYFWMNLMWSLEAGYRMARIEDIKWENSGKWITEGSGTLGDAYAIDYTGPFVSFRGTIPWGM
jgi:hypothetical protein